MALIYDTQSLFIRAATKIFRNPTLLFINVLTPLLFLLLFSQLLQKMFVGLTGSYLDYLTPGILVMNTVIGAFQSGLSIVNDFNSGFLQKVLLTPASRAAILLGRLLTDLLMVIFQSLIIIGVAMLMGLRISSGVPGFLLILVTLALFALAWSGLLLAVGLRTKKAETVSAVGNLLAFPLLFISSALFVSSTFPRWAQIVSDYNPITYVSNVTRDLIQGGLTWGNFSEAYAIIIGMAVVTFAATLYQFRKVVS
jgi:ABC-2 type transport system permease protein